MYSDSFLGCSLVNRVDIKGLYFCTLYLLKRPPASDCRLKCAKRDETQDRAIVILSMYSAFAV